MRKTLTLRRETFVLCCLLFQTPETDGSPIAFYDPVAAIYRPDSTNQSASTRTQLMTQVAAEGFLMIMGVPQGSGIRMGIDRDLDGTLDGDLPAPALRITTETRTTVVSWPTNAKDFLLERAFSLAPASWQPDLSLRRTNGAEFQITNSFTSTNLFFRLREP